MNLPTLSPYLEDLFLLAEENELRDAFANRYYLHREPSFYEALAKLIQGGMDPESAYRKLVLKEMSQEEKEEFAAVAFGVGLDSFLSLEEETLKANPYFVLLSSLKENREGSLRFFQRDYAPYEVFLCDNPYEEDFKEILPLGYFAKGLSFPALEKGKTVWMSLIPHEIKTMEPCIEEVSGSVLVLGIGLGYFGFMAANKENVNKVTLVENDPSIISFFKKTLLPLFPHKDKIEIIEGDALDYYRKHNGEYDSCFVDIYHNEEDGLPIYLSLLPYEKTKTLYWVENALLLYFRRYVLSFLGEVVDGYGKEAYEDRSDFPSALFGALFDASKDITLASDEEIKDFLCKENLKKFAETLKL